MRHCCYHNRGCVCASLIFIVFDEKTLYNEIELDHKDLRWVGAWWLGFLVASSLLFLTALPYLFFPREMPKEDVENRTGNGVFTGCPNGVETLRTPARKGSASSEPAVVSTISEEVFSFPRIALRTLRSPIYLLVVLGQVNLAALLSGLATFMAKFIEKQFSQTISFSNMMIGGVGIPLAVLGIVLGGALMRRFNVSVSGASKLCSGVILLCMFSALPMLFMGCSTKTVAGIYPERVQLPYQYSLCQQQITTITPGDQTTLDPNYQNFTDCRCINNGSGTARPGTCGSGCSHLLPPFMALLALTSFITSFSQTPSYMMILRTIPAEDKSFAVGVQYMLFRVLGEHWRYQQEKVSNVSLCAAFMPGPVLYGSVIDTTCIMWGEKCGQKTSCQYYDLDSFRQRYPAPSTSRRSF
ncbi:hypothetical protein XENOCAPTIV_024160 [Xenoophorus captivus]|uniref:Solute carrier organic anion transporter family member n=1 Tax=Xenoophorus captivus TaxID=1517983 RepID=A0ABV0S303_9TELE